MHDPHGHYVAPPADDRGHDVNAQDSSARAEASQHPTAWHQGQ